MSPSGKDMVDISDDEDPPDPVLSKPEEFSVHLNLLSGGADEVAMPDVEFADAA